MAKGNHNRASRPVKSRNPVKTTIQTGPAGQRLINRDHIDGRRAVTVQPAPIRLRAKAEVVDTRTVAVARPGPVSTKAAIEARRTR